MQSSVHSNHCKIIINAIPGLIIIFMLLESVKNAKINVITVIIGRNPSYGYEATAAAYDVALEDMKMKYPALFSDVSYHLVFQPGTFSCPEGGELIGQVAPTRVWNLLEESLDGFTVMFCPGCSMDLIPLGDYAREWDISLFASVASNPGLANKQRYPTLTTFPASDDTSLPSAAKLFLDLFNWRTVTLICDISTKYQGLYTQYTLSFANVVGKLSENAGVFQFQSVTFDSSKTLKNYETELISIREVGRVIMLFARPEVIRNVLISAHRLNMTNGDYIFLSLQTTTVPYYGNLTWQYHQPDDGIAFEAFRSLIAFTNPDPDWTKLATFLERYANISEQNYNYTFTEDDLRNDYAVSSYESFEAFALVLNQSKDELDHLHARDFAMRFRNKNYSFASRTFYLNNDGIRINDVGFFRLNSTSGKMEETWHYDSITMDIYAVSNLSNIWQGGNGPPNDRFLCGYKNDLCITRAAINRIAITCSIGGTFLCVLCGCCIYRKRSKSKKINSLWWWLDPKWLDNPSAERINSALRKDTAAAALKSFKIELATDKAFTYYGQPVWIQSFTPAFSVQQLLSNGTIRTILSVLRTFTHENIGVFFGVLTSQKFTNLLFESGARGSMRMLLDNETFIFDDLLQSSVSWDVLSGLEYIHGSALQVHGSLCSITAMVDRRFCVRICDYGTTKILMTLINRNIASSTDAGLLWKAPEIIANFTQLPTKEADMYSLGLVLAEIYTGRSPFGVNLNYELQIQECLKKLFELRSQLKPRIVLRPELQGSPIEPLIINCLAWVPHERPTLKLLMQKISHHIPRENIVNSLAARLKQYADELEQLVNNRTQDLRDERKKVDALLAEIIPMTFVQKLRNKQLVEAETFDSVTILFSDFPNFATFSARNTPLTVIRQLNLIYSIFDGILARFDVYKVETINDSYLVASGLPKKNGTRHTAQIAQMALAMLIATEKQILIDPSTSESMLRIRSGFHSGGCAAGIVGVRMPRYCLFGDTVNTASRMESHGEASKIHLSEASHQLLEKTGNGFLFENRGCVFIKGKGYMNTFWLLGLRE